MTQDVTALDDGTVSEHVQVLARVGEEWATIRNLQVGWSGPTATWNCYPFNTANSPTQISPDASDDYDFGISATWNPGDVQSMRDSFEPLDRQFRWGTDDPLPIGTAYKVVFPTDQRQRIVGLECMRRTSVHTTVDAQTVVQPARLGIDVQSLGPEAALTVTYEKTALRVPREWTRVSGLAEELDAPETSDPYIRISGGTSAFGLMGSDFVYRDPARQRWIDVTFATFALLASVLIGMTIQVGSDRRAGARKVLEGADKQPPQAGPATARRSRSMPPPVVGLVGGIVVFIALIRVFVGAGPSRRRKGF